MARDINKEIKTGITSIKIPLSRACRNLYLDPRSILTVMIAVEKMPRAIYCK